MPKMYWVRMAVLQFKSDIQRKNSCNLFMMPEGQTILFSLK